MLLSRKKKPSAVFVNPYAPKIPASTSKINPYVTEYGVVKKKSVLDVIREKLRPEKIPEQLAAHKLGEPYPIVVVVKPPTFLHDMNEMFIRDIMGVASRFTTHKKKEKVMTSDEKIGRAHV